MLTSKNVIFKQGYMHAIVLTQPRALDMENVSLTELAIAMLTTTVGSVTRSYALMMFVLLIHASTVVNVPRTSQV